MNILLLQVPTVHVGCRVLVEADVAGLFAGYLTRTLHRFGVCKVGYQGSALDDELRRAASESNLRAMVGWFHEGQRGRVFTAGQCHSLERRVQDGEFT